MQKALLCPRPDPGGRATDTSQTSKQAPLRDAVIEWMPKGRKERQCKTDIPFFNRLITHRSSAAILHLVTELERPTSIYDEICARQQRAPRVV